MFIITICYTWLDLLFHDLSVHGEKMLKQVRCVIVATADPMSILWRSRSPATVSRVNGSITLMFSSDNPRQHFKTTLLCIKER